MPAITLDTKAFDAGIDVLIERVRNANDRIVTDGAHVVQARAASKLRVGYGVISGTMRRGLHVDGPHRTTPDRSWAEMRPGVIYTRRFELGFLPPLRDSLGRVFPHDQPRPFIKPAFRESREAISAIAHARWKEALRGR